MSDLFLTPHNIEATWTSFIHSPEITQDHSPQHMAELKNIFHVNLEPFSKQKRVDDFLNLSDLPVINDLFVGVLVRFIKHHRHHLCALHYSNDTQIKQLTMDIDNIRQQLNDLTHRISAIHLPPNKQTIHQESELVL